MGVKLLNEVLDHAPADWTQAERLFIAVLAEKARDTTRRAWPGQTAITRRTGLKPDSVTRMCHRLAGKGWELRERQGVDKNGKAVFAYRGQAAVYVIPPMCPLGEHDADVCFPPKARTVVRPFVAHCELAGESETGATDDESPDDGPAIDPGSPDKSPVIAEERADGGPVFPEQSPDGGPAFSGKARTVVRESPDGGPPLTVIEPSKFNPQGATPAAGDSLIPSQRSTDAVLDWAVTHDAAVKQPLTPTNPPRTTGQAALFAASNVKISDREQIILDALRSDDYPEATPADAKAVDKMVRRAHPGKGIGYLRGIATGSGFTSFYLKVREERAKKVDDQIKALERTKPACAHGTLAGNELHPTHGTMLCPQCRAGIPAEPDEPTTHPVVAAALDAYSADHTGYLSVMDRILLAQEAAALHAAGATSEQLTALAHSAARTGVGLFAAATRKDH
ncbi:helix-turn-helix domain-containing protein [Micromonospora arborensis]|uniref:helix-turn-helix domain-containing protein n=1 Tax=Micromonospora arborensis TaxID=2116518 RepID=UPI00340A631D